MESFSFINFKLNFVTICLIKFGVSKKEEKKETPKTSNEKIVRILLDKCNIYTWVKVFSSSYIFFFLFAFSVQCKQMG